MKGHDWLVAFLLVIIIILSLSLINTRLSIQDSVVTVEVEAPKEKVLFVGDSITDFYHLDDYYDYESKLLINSGISGYKTTDIIRRFSNLVQQHQANKMFLMIGTNDLGIGTDKDKVVSNIISIIDETKDKSPKTKIYLESIYPVNRSKRAKTDKRYNEDIRYINEKLKEYCLDTDITYLDVYTILADKDLNLKDEYTQDGLHLNDAGYTELTKFLKPYIEE